MNTFSVTRLAESGLEANSTITCDVGLTIGTVRTRYGAVLRLGSDHIAYVNEAQVTDNYTPRANERVTFKVVAKSRGLLVA